MDELTNYFIEVYAIICMHLRLDEQVTEAGQVLIDFYKSDQMAKSESWIGSYHLDLAVVHALLGNQVQALDHFRHLSDGKTPYWLIYANEIAGVFDEVKSDPVYVETIEKLKIMARFEHKKRLGGGEG